jgi:hypothetical protein
LRQIEHVRFTASEPTAVYSIFTRGRIMGRPSEVSSMKKTLLALAGAATIAVATFGSATDADARHRRWVGPAIVGGIAAGALLGGALASPYYYGPGPAYVVEPDLCYTRQRVWVDGRGWRWRRVAVPC